MSRVGKKSITVPSGVSVKLAGREISLTGPKGNAKWKAPVTARLEYDDGAKSISVHRENDTKQSRANHGLARALIANMIQGVAVGFEKRLEIYGTGYGCKLAGRTLQLNIGFSGRNRGKGAQFELPVPEGVEVVVEREQTRGDNEPASILIRGTDKQRVGQFAAEVRSLRRTEPYKGKGIRYKGEHVIRKQGKALTGGG